MPKMKMSGRSKMASGAAPKRPTQNYMMDSKPRAKPGGLNPSGKYSPKKGGGTEGFTAKGGSGMGMKRSAQVKPGGNQSKDNISKPKPKEPVRKVVQNFKANLGSWNKYKKGGAGLG